MEVQRNLDTLDKHLQGKKYMVGEEYTVADMIVFPYVYALKGMFNEFLGYEKYTNVNAWLATVGDRPAVKRGVTVCSTAGKPWKE